MMQTRTFDWSDAAQVRRIAVVDMRVTAIDWIYSIGYVLTAVFLINPRTQDGIHHVVMPFVFLSFIALYMVIRICGPECDRATAMFYANLPRRKRRVFWTHMAGLALFLLAMEAVVCFSVALRGAAARPDETFLLTPCMLTLPFYAAAVCVWTCVVPLSWFSRAPTAIALVFLAAFLGGQESRLGIARAKGTPVPAMQTATCVLILLLVTVLLVLHAYRQWTTRQVGEVAS